MRPQLSHRSSITDSDIVNVFNGIIDAQEKLLRVWNKTVIEVQPGKQQIEYHEDSDQWVPMALRWIIGHRAGEPAL